jgi:multiple sugar transport system permease protein
VISVYIYNQSFTTYQLGYGAAGAVVALLVSLILGIGYVRSLKVQV